MHTLHPTSNPGLNQGNVKTARGPAFATGSRISQELDQIESSDKKYLHRPYPGSRSSGSGAIPQITAGDDQKLCRGMILS